MLIFQLIRAFQQSLTFCFQPIALTLHGFAFASQFGIYGFMKSLAFGVQFFTVFFNDFALLIQFGLQSLVNMGSTLRLMPTKGMTLPFISYGGSSLVAIALLVGMVLALTRRRVGQEAL